MVEMGDQDGCRTSMFVSCGSLALFPFPSSFLTRIIRVSAKWRPSCSSDAFAVLTLQVEDRALVGKFGFSVLVLYACCT